MARLVIYPRSKPETFSDMDINSYVIASRPLSKTDAIVYREGQDSYIVFFGDCSIGSRSCTQLRNDQFQIVRRLYPSTITFRESE